MLAAFDEGVALISRVAANAAECERGWRERVRAALAALLEVLDEEPRWARFLMLESPLTLIERRRHALAQIARVLERETRGALDNSVNFTAPSRLTAELVVGGVASVLHAHLLEANAGPLTELAPSLMTFIETSYQQVSRGGTEQEHLPVRATYRTMRVLDAINALPRSNNREIAEAAGLRDQGQASKLLNRLERRGLAHNVGLGAAHGEPNAWVLTPSGERVLASARQGSSAGSSPAASTSSGARSAQRAVGAA